MESNSSHNLSVLEEPTFSNASNRSCDFLSPSVSRYQKSLIPVVYMLIFILGFLGNVLAVCVLGQKSLRSTVANTYLLNLAMSDLFFLSSLPFWAAYYVLDYDWPFGSFMCKLCGALSSLNIYASIFFITGMSVDRYRAIVYPLRSHCHESRYRAKSVFQARCLCAIIWVLATLTTVPTIVFRETHYLSDFNVTVCGIKYPGELWHATLTLAKNFLGFVIPFIVIAICYGRIGWHLLASPDLVEPDSARLERVRRLALAVVAAFFVCWFPFHVLAFMGALKELGVEWSCGAERALGAMMPASLSLGFANSAVNPLLYCFVGNRFRQQLRRLCEEKVPKIAMQKRDSVSMRLSSFSRNLSDTKDTVASTNPEDRL
ncbi:type-2 angiotensin II receptor [Trichomycterus rosablanca]|uniref:type-2 angiotensin II receptor n=1 Tax=Trichomycterus rosablanca TaxID=2290929 RepID=UPI002F34F9D8